MIIAFFVADRNFFQAALIFSIGKRASHAKSELIKLDILQYKTFHNAKYPIKKTEREADVYDKRRESFQSNRNKSIDILHGTAHRTK